jgi:hypothetical protein
VEGEDQSNILICACCSYTGAPFLEGWPWAAENPEVGNNSTDGSFSMVHMRCRSQIEFVQTKDHQLLSEGSEDYHITNFVGVQGLTYVRTVVQSHLTKISVSEALLCWRGMIERPVVGVRASILCWWS